MVGHRRFGGSFPCYTTVAAVGVRDRHAKRALMVFSPWRVVDAPEGADPSSRLGHTSLLSFGCRGLFRELAEPFVAPGESTRAQIVGDRADPLQLGLERGALVLGLEQEESGQALRSGAAELGVDPGRLVLERGHPRLELAQRVLGL